MKYWFVYMLFCDNSSFYIGITNDLINRFRQHINKQSTATKEFFSLKLIYCEQCEDKHQAALRERQLKGWNRARSRC